MFPGRRSLLATPRTRVELHIHLEATIRHETVWELMRAKNMKLPGDGSFHALQETLLVTTPVDIVNAFRPFKICIPAIAGDLQAIEKVAYECCEDKARQGVMYAEVRYSPHYLIGKKLTRGMIPELTEVVRAVKRGFTRAEVLEGIVTRGILCVVNNNGGASDILHLCEAFKDDGIVGMDLVAPLELRLDQYEEVTLSGDENRVFAKAHAGGIHRTVHAGEIGGPKMVRRALSAYYAERVGHGYTVLEDESLYRWCKENDVHFECCPWSSIIKGTVKPDVAKHPIAKFAEDEVNFSLSTDIPSFIGSNLQNDYDLAASWGLTEGHIVRSNINALRCSFLPESEKEALMNQLLSAIGLSEMTA